MRLNSFQLKVAAIVGMTTCHTAVMFHHVLPAWATIALNSLGGLTFFIMATLLVEGFHHTRDVRKYAIRLGAFALVAQVPYTLCFGFTANVLFTLLMSLGMLVAVDRWGLLSPRGMLAVLGAIVASFPCDWAIVGPVVVLLTHTFTDRRQGLWASYAVLMAAQGLPAVVIVAGTLLGLGTEGELTQMMGLVATDGGTAAQTLPMVLGITAITWSDMAYCLVGFSVALVMLLSYDGTRGRPMKWFFYAYYPAHLLVLWAIKTLLGV